MPTINDLTDLNELTKEVTNLARDAAYVVVGLGVLGFQRAQVQRVELQSRLAKTVPSFEGGIKDVRAQVTRQAKSIDDIVEGAVKFIESTLQPIEAQLPAPARDAVKKAHEQAREIRSQIRELVVPAA
jgi:ElaB/YqjD/DUF883 family membrane-anchored ribosome-binding protein